MKTKVETQKSVSKLPVCIIEESVVAGSHHVPHIDEQVRTLAPAARLVLVHDKQNPFDKWAVAVYNGQVRIGYVSCEHNEIVARMLDGGLAVCGRLRNVAKVDNWTRICMGVYLYD